MTMRTKPPVPLEREVLAACLEYLQALGIDCQRRNTAAFTVGDGPSRRFVRCGEPGDPDIAGTLPDGRTLHIEVKRPGKRPRPAQYARLRKTIANHGVALWVDSVAGLMQAMPKLLNGASMEIDQRGYCEIVWED